MVSVITFIIFFLLSAYCDIDDNVIYGEEPIILFTDTVVSN